MALLLLQPFSLVYLLLILTCAASFLSHDEECLALLEFKQTILHDAPGFRKFDSWRKTKSNTSDHSDCCLFDGVVCSNKGHVIGLDLSGSSLSGTINSSSTLFKLVHLQMLNLSMNNFVESQIPSEIARLKHLRSLDLSESGFSGQIPNEISHLTQLSSLDLSWNLLKLHNPGFEYLLQNMTRLENLHLSGVNLSSSVPRFLANFSSLTSIQLRECRLLGEFPSAIFHLPKLKYLIISKNNLTGFLPEFHNTSLLEHLGMYLTDFSGSIPTSFSNLTQLSQLSLAQNEFTGLVPSLASLSRLTILELSYNSFDIRGVYDWINKLTKLQQLDLVHMNIHDEILPYIANLTELRYFLMRANSISGGIPSSFRNLTQLILLDLSYNQLEGQISSAFLNFKNLEYLSISYNNFSSTTSLESFLGLNKLQNLYLDGINMSFLTTTNYTNGTLPELKYLGMSSCNLKEFPAFLRFQMNMTGLMLNDNEIEGLIPNWIWNNSKETLQTFSLQNNFITGFHQHSHFLPWNRLQSFDMSSNQLQGRLLVPPETIIFYQVSNNNLTGEIPPWICEMKTLQVLDLSYNKMTGTLPSCLGNLNNLLSVLVLNGNNLNGPIMNLCTRGSPLKKIDLSENLFTGKLPTSLADCTELEFLALADNSFEDIFPVWLGTLPNLQVLILMSNKFYGSIKGFSIISSLFVKLRIIDISNNYFTGQLPEKLFQTWNAMKSSFVGESSAMGSEIHFDSFKLRYMFSYTMTLTNKGVKREYTEIQDVFTVIDLSCNNFEGRIPESLQDLHGIQSLNLSNNHFTGRILPSLGNLKNLESLDLSQNKLSGQIPQQLLQLGFLAILNVSFNRLDGRIPQGKQFNTFENNSYLGNPGLCGKPLSKECENSNASTVLPVPAASANEYESLLPSNIIDWMVILLGVGSGLVIGILIGNFLYARYGNWLLERFGVTRKHRWVRPLRNTRRN